MPELDEARPTAAGIDLPPKSAFAADISAANAAFGGGYWLRLTKPVRKLRVTDQGSSGAEHSRLSGAFSTMEPDDGPRA